MTQTRQEKTYAIASSLVHGRIKPSLTSDVDGVDKGGLKLVLEETMAEAGRFLPQAATETLRPDTADGPRPLQ